MASDTKPQPESRFISADERCPHPERWSSWDGESTEIEVTELIAALARALQPELVIETGSAFGQTTRAILQALERNGHGLLYTFEIEEDRRRDLPVGHPQLLVGGDSLEGDLDGLPSVDLAFFDSLFETRVPEFQRFRSQMHAGTVVAFHDTAGRNGEHRIAGGRSLREELADLPELALIDLPTPRGLTLGQVL